MHSVKYRILKSFVIGLQVINVPIGVYAGAKLALGDNTSFVVGLAISMFFLALQSSLWWKTMEMLNTGSSKK